MSGFQLTTVTGVVIDPRVFETKEAASEALRQIPAHLLPVRPRFIQITEITE